MARKLDRKQPEWFTALLQKGRDEAGSSKALAIALDVSEARISQLLKDDREMPSLDLAERLIDHMGGSIERALPGSASVYDVEAMGERRHDPQFHMSIEEHHLAMRVPLAWLEDIGLEARDPRHKPKPKQAGSKKRQYGFNGFNSSVARLSAKVTCGLMGCVAGMFGMMD